MRQKGFGLIEALVVSIIIAIAIAGAMHFLVFIQHQLMCDAGQIKLGCRAVILPNPANGCQYIVNAGSITPNMGLDGKQLGCRLIPAPETLQISP